MRDQEQFGVLCPIQGHLQMWPTEAMDSVADLLGARTTPLHLYPAHPHFYVSLFPV